MIWRLLSSIKGVYGNLQVNSNWLSYFLKDYTFCIRDLQDNYNIKKEIKIESDLSYKVIGNDFYFFGYGTLFCLNLESSKLTEIVKTDKQYIEALSDNLFLASSYSRKTKCHESQLLNYGNIKWEFSGTFGFRKSFGEFLVFSSNFNNQISTVGINTGKELWVFPLPENEKIMGEMYLHKGVLIFATMEGEIYEDKNYLYGIDVNTGKLQYKREGAFHYYQKQSETGFLFGFGHGFYEVTNPVTGQRIVEKKLTDELWVSQHMNFLGSDGLYFVGGNHTNMGMFICKFGKINIETHQIEFIQNLDVAEGVKADPPIYHDGRLYIKDSENVLHIYEKNESQA